MQRIRLDEHTLQIKLTKQPLELGALMVVASGMQAWAIATPKAAEYKVTWAINAEPPPLVGSMEPRRVLASQIK